MYVSYSHSISVTFCQEGICITSCETWTATAKYPIEMWHMNTFSLAAGNRMCNQDNLFLGSLAKCIVIGLVDNDSFTGT